MQKSQQRLLTTGRGLSQQRIREMMCYARDLADIAAQQGDVPVGAVILSPEGDVIGEGYNQVYQGYDVSAHAEIMALRQACQTYQTPKLLGCHLIVTLEPCAMCAQAIAWAHLQTLIYGLYDPKSGGVDHGARIFDHPTCHHKPFVIGGVMTKGLSQQLTDFFKQKRD